MELKNSGMAQTNTHRLNLCLFLHLNGFHHLHDWNAAAAFPEFLSSILISILLTCSVRIG